jgi:hypothetical protein
MSLRDSIPENYGLRKIVEALIKELRLPNAKLG